MNWASFLTKTFFPHAKVVIFRYKMRVKSTFVVLLILSVVLFTFPQIEVVKAQGTIYIRADGTLEGTDKIQRDGNIYTFTGNVSGAIILEKGSIIIDGNGYILTGDADNHGFYLAHINDTTIKNVRIENCNYGVYISESVNNTITENTVTGNNLGIVTSYSKNTLITENNVLNNVYVGINCFHSENDTVTKNVVTNNGDHGILLHSSTKGCYISENEILNSGSNGIRMGWATTNNTITENKIQNSGENGISLYESRFNTISRNNIDGNNANGIYQTTYCTNVIILNNITSNREYGIYNNQWTSNQIYHNNFIDNGNQATNYPGDTSTWDNGFPSGGNYWSDYNGTDNNGDGIGDTPYIIDENNQDNYPLVNVIPEFPSWIILPLFFTATLFALIVKKRLFHPHS